MTVYNSGKYLESAVNSILTQKFRDFEFIIINDGSSDNSSQILRKFQKKDYRIKLIERENKGLIYSLNEGIKHSSSEFIARMDSDDLCHPDRFSLQYEYLQDNIEVVALGTFIDLIDSDDDVISSNFVKFTDHFDIDRQHISGHGGAIIHPSAMIRRSALEKVGQYNESYPHAEDLDLWLRLAEVGQLANLNISLLKYRQHVDSVGYTKREIQIDSALKAVRAAYERRKIPNFDLSQINHRNPHVSTFGVYLKWAWWAYNSSNYDTCKKYTLKLFSRKPWNTEVLKLLILLAMKKV